MEQIYNIAVEAIKKRCGIIPETAVVLGSGLGTLADAVENGISIPYEEIPGFLASTTPGHAGKLLLGRIGKKPCVLMQGRFHYYEGYRLQDTVFPIRLFKLLGVKTIVLTNAAGGINLSFEAGDLMLIRDHINFSGNNPLIGMNEEDFGPRFPDMSHAYSRRLNGLMRQAAEICGIRLKEGVFVMMSGPSFETPAEIRMLRMIGADAVGMSTVPEAIAAAQCGLETVGVSCITNLAAGVSDRTLSHEEVLEAGLAASEKFKNLLLQFIKMID
ncbi:MAG: purine-nucleoside phosphorylase [Bacillota bacterium]|nr:purine-nucleoside phosphorylase [Bacillota bacterium]